MKFYVTGSSSKARDIKRMGIAFSTQENTSVRYVERVKKVPLKEHMNNCFNDIEWADCVLAVLNDDLTIEDEYLYEIVYAQRLNKFVALIPKVPEVII